MTQPPQYLNNTPENQARCDQYSRDARLARERGDWAEGARLEAEMHELYILMATPVAVTVRRRQEAPACQDDQPHNTHAGREMEATR